MRLADRITDVLTPHMGAFSADAAARHVCAKLQIGDTPDEQQLKRLYDYLRQGLVAYVGPERAEVLAAECVRKATVETTAP
jgi:hypothetical protein